MVTMNSIVMLWQNVRGARSPQGRRSARLAALSARYQPSSLSGTTTSGLSRIEVRPPSLRHAPTPLLQRLLFWIIAPSPLDASPPLNRLPGVQREFRVALADIDGHHREGRDALMDRIARARSLRELWHMRLDVYNLVATAHSEFEAAQRLALLNRHFPRRATRASSFGAL